MVGLVKQLHHGGLSCIVDEARLGSRVFYLRLGSRVREFSSSLMLPTREIESVANWSQEWVSDPPLNFTPFKLVSGAWDRTQSLKLKKFGQSNKF